MEGNHIVLKIYFKHRNAKYTVYNIIYNIVYNIIYFILYTVSKT